MQSNAIDLSGNSVKRFLITTADESTWVFDRPVLFLGHWCLDQNRKHVWSQMDYLVFEPEISAAELDQNFVTMNHLYKDLLIDITAALNEFHKCNYSLRYWAILVGPWLRLFCNQIMFRWTYLNIAKSRYDLDKAQQPVSEFEMALRPHNFIEYQKISKDVAWSANLYSKLWDFMNSRGFIESGSKSLPLGLVADTTSKLATKKTRSRKIVIADSYLPRKSEIGLSFLVRSPRIKVARVSPPVVPFNDLARGSLKFPGPIFNDLHCISRELIIDQLPSSYLEGYGDLKNLSTKLRFGEIPATIFTSNRHFYDDVFNIWAAKATEGGSKYVIGQHGGHYGTSLYKSHAELHEQEVADLHLTWGWGTFANQIKGPCLKMIGKKERKSHSNGNLLVVCDEMFKHPRSLFYGVTENTGYLEFVSSCLLNLSKSVKDQVLVRLNHAHASSGDSQIDWWSVHAPEIEVDDGLTNISGLRKSAKLVVTTFNGTTFLETLHLNIPTIITWSDTHCNLRTEAKPHFKDLQRVGIFHDSVNSFSTFINSNWQDIESWWTSDAVQDARIQFCSIYARKEKKPLKFLKNVLKSPM